MDNYNPERLKERLKPLLEQIEVVSVPWDAVSAIATVVIALGIPAGFIQLKNSARNERYEQYVKRYEEIITHLPYGVFEKGSEKVDVKPDQMQWLSAYVDLCAEELFDYLRGAIEGQIWDDWKVSILNDFDRSAKLMDVFKHLDKTEYEQLNSFICSRETPPKAEPLETVLGNLTIVNALFQMTRS